MKNVETWPRVASKYIHDPLLFEGCKFDLRYIVLVRSFEPLEVVAHRRRLFVYS